MSLLRPLDGTVRATSSQLLRDKLEFMRQFRIVPPSARCLPLRRCAWSLHMAELSWPLHLVHASRCGTCAARRGRAQPSAYAGSPWIVRARCSPSWRRRCASSPWPRPASTVLPTASRGGTRRCSGRAARRPWARGAPRLRRRGSPSRCWCSRRRGTSCRRRTSFCGRCWCVALSALLDFALLSLSLLAFAHSSSLLAIQTVLHSNSAAFTYTKQDKGDRAKACTLGALESCTGRVRVQKAPEQSVNYSNTQAAATVAAGEWCCLDLAIQRLNGDGGAAACSIQSGACSEHSPHRASSLTRCQGLQSRCSMAASHCEASSDACNGVRSNCSGAVLSMAEGEAACGIELLVAWSRECWRADERGLEAGPRRCGSVPGACTASCC